MYLPRHRGSGKRLVKCFVWSVALHGTETWILRRSEEKRIEAYEMWIWRRMERVKWTDRIRNEAVLERVGEERMMLKLIRKRKRNWLGTGCLLKNALEGMVNGRSSGQKIGKIGESWVYSERPALGQNTKNHFPHSQGTTTILDKTSGYWDLVIKEAIEIQLDGNNFNRDGGLQLSTAWKPAINTLRPPAHSKQSGPARWATCQHQLIRKGLGLRAPWGLSSYLCEDGTWLYQKLRQDGPPVSVSSSERAWGSGLLELSGYSFTKWDLDLSGTQTDWPTCQSDSRVPLRSPVRLGQSSHIEGAQWAKEA
ncbi:hypothetical protein ANN_03663 [Periplaneta americana]|uniref:Uncharacterized protein n=1 Tax=Periplaneta americana TaxID=6978 RepID=A0ABQ8U5D7_PERAM|nr:hypothetical protein ANN_03663 [Periplaneta americana]